MAAEAEAARQARAKVIRAAGEQKATLALRQAANELASNPNAMKLRYLQTLSSIGNEKNSTTIIFPVPVDTISHFVRLSANGRSSLKIKPPMPKPPIQRIPRIEVHGSSGSSKIESSLESDDFLLPSPPSF